MGEFNIARDGDPNTHGRGYLQANRLQRKVFVGDIQVCLGPPGSAISHASIAPVVPGGFATAGLAVGDFASSDRDCDDDHPPTHCLPYATEGSSKVFVQGIGVHRDTDRRWCGATTEASDGKVFAG